MTLEFHGAGSDFLDELTSFPWGATSLSGRVAHTPVLRVGLLTLLHAMATAQMGEPAWTQVAGGPYAGSACGAFDSASHDGHRADG